MIYIVNKLHEFQGDYIGTMGEEVPELTVRASGNVTVFSSNFYVNCDGYGVYITSKPMSDSSFKNTHINHR